MVRIGIIGTGGMAEYQAKRFSKINNCQLWACKDQHTEHAIKFAERFHIPYWYTNVDTMLSDPSNICDAYTCAVLDERHAFIGEKLLSSGKPLLMEKPLGRTLLEAKQLYEQAQKIKIVNLVNFSKRNAPALWALNKLLKDNYLGRIYFIKAEYHQSWVATKCWGDWVTTLRWRWRLQPQTSTAGIIGDLGSHVVDALLLLFGSIIPRGISEIIRLDEAIQNGVIPQQKIDSSFFNQQGTVPIKASGSFYFIAPNETTVEGTIDLSWISPNTVDQFKITIYGENEHAVLDLSISKDEIYIYDQNNNLQDIMTHPAVPSTYELLINQAVNKNSEIIIPIPDFQQGYLVQRTLDKLFPGVLPT